MLDASGFVTAVLEFVAATMQKCELRIFVKRMTTCMATIALLSGCGPSASDSLRCDGNWLGRNCVLLPSRTYLGISLGMTKKAVFDVLCKGANAKVFHRFSSEYNSIASSGETYFRDNISCGAFGAVKPSNEWRVHSRRGTCLFTDDETITYTYKDGKLSELRTHCAAIPTI
jgi:hypothetical protein